MDGLFGNESNPVNASDPNSTRVNVTKGSPYVATFDPSHAFTTYNFKLFGTTDVDQCVDPTMQWFYEYEEAAHEGEGDFVMSGFSPDDLPVTVQLASEFAVFNYWYAAFPGPSWPNHMMSITATSAGDTETGTYYEGVPGQLYPQKTIFEQLEDDGLSWNWIYNDSFGEGFLEWFSTDRGAAGLADMSSSPHTSPVVVLVALAPRFFPSLPPSAPPCRRDTFFANAAAGTLPTLTWIQSREGVNESLGAYGGPNSDHPSCCDVALGELLRKQVYEALRAGPGWNDTLFLMTWDDAGGFYEHARPPMSAPAPDNHTSYPDSGFLFDRLGSRLPVVLASPRIPKGTVINDPNNTSTDPDMPTKFDSTSLVGTMKEMFNLTSFLTDRDAWSGKFHDLFTDTPRTDTPYHLEDAPPPAGIWPSNDDLDDCDQPRRRSKRAIQLFELVHNTTAPPQLHECAHKQPHWMHHCGPGTMAEATRWLSEQTELLRARGQAWREAKQATI